MQFRNSLLQCHDLFIFKLNKNIFYGSFLLLGMSHVMPLLPKMQKEVFIIPYIQFHSFTLSAEFNLLQLIFMDGI